jgi:hypothetical protein
MSFNLTAGDPRSRQAFFQGLRDLGYVEGKNLVIDTGMPRGSPTGSLGSRPSWPHSR